MTNHETHENIVSQKFGAIMVYTVTFDPTYSNGQTVRAGDCLAHQWYICLVLSLTVEANTALTSYVQIII